MYRTHHVHDGDVSVGKDDSIGGVGHGQQEGEGRAQGGGDQDVQWVDVDCLRLRKDTSNSSVPKTKPCVKHGAASFRLLSVGITWLPVETTFDAYESCRMNADVCCVHGFCKTHRIPFD